MREKQEVKIAIRHIYSRAQSFKYIYTELQTLYLYVP